MERVERRERREGREERMEKGESGGRRKGSEDIVEGRKKKERRGNMGERV